MLPYLIAGAIGYGIAKLFQEDEAPKYADGGLIAPNGKPSNLTPEQYKLVRTPAFKQWFGDWENSPETASKVVDSNGEPLVVYHGSNIDFNVFEKSKTNPYAEKQGYFFAISKKYAESYNSKYVKPFFINIRIEGTFDDDDNIVPFNADGNIVQGLQVEVYDKNNIKLADGTNTTFDGNNTDIRFAGGGDVNEKLILDFVNQIETYQSNHYGTYNRDNLVNSYLKLPASFKEKIKPKSTNNLYRGADGFTSSKSAISFTKNKEYANFFGVYTIPFNTIKNYDGLIDTERLGNELGKLRIDNEIGDDEGEVIVLNPVFTEELLKNIEEYRNYADGGSVLLAPNGKPSNLTPEQYMLVRTPAFKEWFGDWENDPANASKVVDSNGEPLVVYHGTKENWWNDYFVFNPQYEGKSTNIKRRKFGSIYFTSKKKVAQTFGNILIPVFLNFENPIVIDADYHDIMWVDNEIEKTNYEDDIIIKNTYDYRASNVELDADMSSDIFLVSQLFNKIKLADGTNTTFDGNNPDIRFDKGGITISDEFSNESYDFGNVGNSIKKNNREVGQIQYDINKEKSIVRIYLLEVLEKGIGAKVINYFFNNGINTIYGDAVDSIEFWNKMGAKYDEFDEDINGYPFTISKEDFVQTKYYEDENNPDIRYASGGEVLSYNYVLKKQQTGDYYFDVLFSNKNSKFIEETIDIKELRELNGFSDDEDEIEQTISYFNDNGMDEDYEIGRELMNKIVNGTELNPIVVDENYKVLDGSHRLSAYSELYYYYSYDYPFDGILKIYKRISN